MNIRKPNNKKIRLSLVSLKPFDIKTEGKSQTKKSFDDGVLTREKDEFWNDCLDSNLNTNVQRSSNDKPQIKKKANSVYVENNNQLHLIKESEENKEDTCRKITNSSLVDCNLTFKKEGKFSDYHNSNNNSENPNYSNFDSSPQKQNHDVIQKKNKHQNSVKSRQEKFKELLTKVGQTEEDIFLNKGISNEYHFSNGSGTHNNRMASEKRVDRCHFLYEKGKMKSELNKINLQKKIEEKEEKIVSECTFQPRTSSAGRPLEKISGKEFYDRTVNWKKQQLEKLEREKLELQSKEVVYSFKPEIHKPNNKILFNPKKNLNKDDRITKKFISRLENARNKECEKKERFENLGKVKVNNNPVTHNIKTSMLDLGHGQYETGQNLDDLVKNLRKELRDINLESNNEIYL